MNDTHQLELFVEAKSHLRLAMRALAQFAHRADEEHNYRDPEAHAIYAAIEGVRRAITSAVAKRMSGQSSEALRDAWHTEMQETTIKVHPYSAQIWQWRAFPRIRHRFDLQPNFVFLTEKQIRDMLQQIDAYHERLDQHKHEVMPKDME